MPVVRSAVVVAEKWCNMSGLLPQGLSALSADPKTGKTLIRFGDEYFTPEELFALNFKGGKDDDGGDKKVKIQTPKDIDMPIKRGKQASMPDIYKPKVQKTFKDGGLVRGCGVAQRGKTRGKMV